MRSRTNVATSAAAERTSAAIDGLRTMLVVCVVAVHSFLAYLSFLPQRSYPFDDPPWTWRSYPIVDHVRVPGLEIFCACVDTFVMSLFFLVSGLFVWRGLHRKGAARFARDRLLRLGVPFAAVVLLLLPEAHFPIYALSSPHPGVPDFVAHWLALPFWPTGPLWFLWLLLAADLTVAALLGRQGALVTRLSSFSAQRPGLFLVALLACSAAAYVPFALAFGPMRWFQEGPISFQLSRPGLYAVYFFAGIVIGAGGIGQGLFTESDILAQRWKRWLASAVLAFAVWLGISARTMLGQAPAPLAWQIADDLSYALTCFASCFCALAVALRFARPATSWWRSVELNAYGIYLLHYVFVVWLQYALLFTSLPGVFKAAAVLTVTLSVSWGASAAFRRMGSAISKQFSRNAMPRARTPGAAEEISPGSAPVLEAVRHAP